MDKYTPNRVEYSVICRRLIILKSPIYEVNGIVVNKVTKKDKRKIQRKPVLFRTRGPRRGKGKNCGCYKNATLSVRRIDKQKIISQL